MIFKRGKVYWYKFLWRSKLVRESTRQRNDKVARQLEAAHKTRLAKGEVGILDKGPAPALGAFLSERVKPWAERLFGETKPKSLAWYRNELRVLSLYKTLANTPIDRITGELVSQFVAWRLRQGKQIATVNSSLRVLRRVLNLAVEWGVVAVAPKLKTLGGERRREHVVTVEEEARYLAVAQEPLGSIATILIDSGMRPEELFRLKWESVNWTSGKHGTILVSHGKTAAARRILPMTPRVRMILETRWDKAKKPSEGWIWPAATRSGHMEPSTIRKQHTRTFEVIAKQSAQNDLKPIRPFVLYSLRHTFLTRLGESGCDVWTLARIAGHSSITVSSRYVHPSDAKVLEAMSRVGSHSSGHSENQEPPAQVASRQLTQ